MAKHIYKNEFAAAATAAASETEKKKIRDKRT